MVFFFDRWGDTWVAENWSPPVLINPRKEIKLVTHIGDDPCPPNMSMAVTDDGVLVVASKKKAYRYNKDHFEVISQLSPRHSNYDSLYFKFTAAAIAELALTPQGRFDKKLANGESIYWKLTDLPTANFFAKISPGLFCMGTRHGVYFKDIKTGKTIDSFLNGRNVSSCIVARDSSLWFGTLGNGLYHFLHSFIKSIPVGQLSGRIRFIKAMHNNVCFISGESSFVEAKLNTRKQLEVIDEKELNPPNFHGVYFYICHDRQNNWITCDPSIVKYLKIGSKPMQRQGEPYCKVILEEGDTNLIVGATAGIYRFNKDKFILTDTLYNNRVTSLAKIDSIVYAGTLTGLIAIHPGKRVEYFFKQNSLLKGHITALCSDNKHLWVANNRAILTNIYKGQIIASINENKGLVCNSISTLIADSSYIWVGTDNGLFTFNKQPPFNIVRHLSVSDGLASNRITYMDIADGWIYVGTDRGLNYFEESEIKPLVSKPAFIINSIQDGEKSVSIQDLIKLKNKTLKISFDVIDHSGIARPKYSYRLKDGNWADIENNELYFPTVPYGNFTVQIKVQSPNWNAPIITALKFSHASPFYLSNWFMVLAGIALGGMIGVLVWLLTRRMRKKEQEQLLVQKNLLQLEQMALQGQMNPHFIFNCITAIRQYYNKGNTEKANKFVDNFSTLIRTTFEMSTQTFTPLDKELAYLSQYLEIERERFNHSFDFSINKQTTSPDESLLVPTMLLQPFVENAVRHGVRHLPDGQGKITISVVQEQENIIITIQDNGIGRTKTLQMKQTQYTATPVTSTRVNKKRIDILNRLFEEKITMRTDDILDDKGEIAGTIVIISYPFDIYVSW